MSGFQPEPGSDEWHQQRASVERGSEAWESLHGVKPGVRRAWYRKKRFILPGGLLLLIIVGGLGSISAPEASDMSDWNRSMSSAGLDTADRSMSFEECNAQIRSMADQLGTPSSIVDSSIMHTVRFSASDGSVLVTCDAIDATMIVVKSPHGG